MHRKRIISALLVILMTCCVLTQSLITTEARVPQETENPWNPISYTFDGFKEGPSYLKYNFAYSDSVFVQDARTGDPDPNFAKMSAAIAMEAYRQADLLKTLDSMGFAVLKSRNYTEEEVKQKEHYVAYTLAEKKISSGGQNYIVYCAAIRGTIDFQEWVSNILMGTEGNHTGFFTAAEEPYEDMKEYMDHDGYDSDHRIIWVTGHSRGAAVSNILAGWFSLQNTYAHPEHIFGYTYACPAVSTLSAVKDAPLTNIFNLNNIEDIVPKVPPAAWGYGRYGVDVDLDTAHYDNLVYQIMLRSNHEYHGILTHADEVQKLEELFPEQNVFEALDNRVTMLLSIAFYTGQIQMISGSVKMLEFLENWYAEHEEELSPQATATVLAIISYFDLTVREVEEYYNNQLFLITAQKELLKLHEYDDWQERIRAWFARNRDKLASIQNVLRLYGMPVIDTESEVGLALSYMDEVIDLYEVNGEKVRALLAILYEKDGTILDAVTDAHNQETYITWVNSMYLGYKGWDQYTGDSLPSFERITTVDDYCFRNVQLDINPKNLNSDPRKVIYFGTQSFCNTGIKDLTLYNELQYLGSECFGSDLSLRKVTLPVDMQYTRTADHGNVDPFKGSVNIETLVYTPGVTGIQPHMWVGSTYGVKELDGDQVGDCKLESIAHENLKTIIYEEGVKELANYAGVGYMYNKVYTTDLKTVVLPDSLEKIGEKAFTEVSPDVYHLGPNLKEIGEYAFSDTQSKFEGSLDSLETVGSRSFRNTSITFDVLKLPGKVTEIGIRAFSGCTGLTGTLEITNAQTIGDCAFADCTGLTKLILPADMIYTDTGDPNLNDLGPVFEGCKFEELEYTPGLTGIMAAVGDRTTSDGTCNNNAYRVERICSATIRKITYDEGITEIAGHACYEYRHNSFTMNELKEVYLPSSLKTVGTSAFNRCTNAEFKYITSPINLEKVGEYSFYDCDGLSIETLVLPGSIEFFSESAFEDCDNLAEELTLTGDEQFDNKAFGSIDSLKKVTLPVDMQYTRTADHGNVDPFKGSVNIETLVYTPGVTGIQPHMWVGSTYGVKELDGDQVGDCKLESIAHENLKTIIYEEGVKELANYAGVGYIYNKVYTTDLKTVVLPDSLEKIGEKAFTEVSPDVYHLGPNLTEVGDYAFSASQSAFEGNASGLKIIGNYAFRNTSITFDNVSFPGQITDIGVRAFEGCTGLSGTLEIVNEMQVKDGAFKDCIGIRKLILPVDKVYTDNMVVNWDDYGQVFAGCAIEELEYKPGLTGIMTEIRDGSTAEGTCNNSAYRVEKLCAHTIRKITYDEGITEIAAYACYRNGRNSFTMNLSDVEFPSTLKTIRTYAFYNTGITKAYLGREVELIEPYAFNSNPDLVMYVYRDTYALQYAKDNNIAYVILDPLPETISLNYSELNIKPTESVQLTATLEPEDASGEILWTSSDESIATVDQNGIVTGIKAGEAVITAEVKENGLTASCQVRVQADEVQPGSITLNTDNVIILYNGSFRLNAEVKPADAIDKTVTWSSHDETIVTVDQNGNIKGVKPGLATITATTVNGLTADCAVRVLFTDVANSTQYFYNPVYWAVDNGITVGAGGAGKFSPNASCTREQIVTFLWRLMGEPEPETTSNFTDVKPTDWYYKPITWAAEKKITVGLNDGTGRFGVGQACTREQCVTFLYRTAGQPEVGAHQEFTDVASDRYYYHSISWAASKGITVGLNDGTGRFGVGQKCTRAMIVTFLHRFAMSE